MVNTYPTPRRPPVQPYHGTYRDQLTVFRANADVDVAVSYARANTQYGAGGLRQLYLPVRWTGPSLNSDQPKVLTETLEIAHHGFTTR